MVAALSLVMGGSLILLRWVRLFAWRFGGSEVAGWCFGELRLSNFQYDGGGRSGQRRWGIVVLSLGMGGSRCFLG